MQDSDGFEIGAAKRKGSPITAQLRALKIGQSVEFQIPLYMSHNAPRSCATLLSKRTSLVFGTRVGVRDGMRIVTIKRVM